MRTVAISEAKARLTELIARVEAGEEILITRRGVSVARIVPTTQTAADDAERLRELERRGVIKLGTGRLPDGFWAVPRPVVRGNAAAEAVIAEREEGR